MTFSLWPIHRIPKLKVPDITDEGEGQEAGGGDSFRFVFGGIGGGVKVDPITIDSADLLAMYGVPYELIPAQGAGKVIIPLFAAWRYVYNAAPYTVGAFSRMTARYPGSFLDPHSQSVFFFDTTLLNFGVHNATVISGLDTSCANWDVVADNAPVVAQFENAGVTGGDGLLKVSIGYVVMS